MHAGVEVLWVAGIALLVATWAIHCAKNRLFRRFAVGLAVAWIASSLLGLWTLSPLGSSPFWVDLLATFALFLIPPLIYVSIVGVLVKHGSSPNVIATATLISSVVAGYVFLYAELLVSCYWYHDCL